MKSDCSIQCPGNMGFQNLFTGMHWKVNPNIFSMALAKMTAPIAYVAYRKLLTAKVRQYEKRRDILMEVTVVVWRKKKANTVLLKSVSSTHAAMDMVVGELTCAYCSISLWVRSSA